MEANSNDLPYLVIKLIDVDIVKMDSHEIHSMNDLLNLIDINGKNEVLLYDSSVTNLLVLIWKINFLRDSIYELRQKNVTYSFSNNVVNAYIKTPRQEYVPRSEVKFTINNDSRMVMFQHPNSEVLFKNVSIKEESKLEFGIGINEIAWGKSGDGVLFEIIMIDENSHRNLIFSKWIDPKNNPEDRKWFDYSLDLQPFHGQKVTFIFRTTDGPRGDNRYDWAGWSRPMITSIVDKNEG
jgi:hypothetical protein